MDEMRSVFSLPRRRILKHLTAEGKGTPWRFYVEAANSLTAVNEKPLEERREGDSLLRISTTGCFLFFFYMKVTLKRSLMPFMY